MTKKPSESYAEVSAGIEEKIETPDANSIIVELTGKIPDNLFIYLIPYTKKVKRIMVYEASCDESEIRKFTGYRISKVYNGVYFFNDVEPGKYLVKLCCYYGNFKLIDKPSGSQSITMDISPPLQ